MASAIEGSSCTATDFSLPNRTLKTRDYDNNHLALLLAHKICHKNYLTGLSGKLIQKFYADAETKVFESFQI